MKRIAGVWCAVAFLAMGCVGSIDDTSNERVAYADNGPRINENEVLVVNLGASISAGFTFDPGLVESPLDPVYAENHHIPRLVALVGNTLGSETDSYNLSVPGATSTEIAAEQLPDALEEIPRYLRGAVITVEAGGNDLRAFQKDYLQACQAFEPICFYQLFLTLGTVDANLHAMLGALREVAPYAPIIIQTQYNPLYGVAFDGTPCADDFTRQFADLVFEGDGVTPPMPGVPPVLGMNPRIRAIAAEYGAAVADVSGYLAYTGNYTNPDAYSSDCTHPAGVQDGIPGLLPPDEVGLGFEAHFAAFALGLQSLMQ